MTLQRVTAIEELAPPGSFALAESPCWDPTRAELMWIDIPAGMVHRGDPARPSSVSVGCVVGAVLPSAGEPLVVCRQGEISLMDPRSEVLSCLSALEPERPDMRPNDAKCDPAGRLWVGTTRLEDDEPSGTLYMVDAARQPAAKLSGLECSNGLGWSPDATAMYFVDSPTHGIDRLGYDLASGAISDRVPLVQVDPADGMPDGLCVDADGGIWVALWGGGCVRRYDAHGALTDQIDLPANRVTSCCLGGPDWRDLYITTAVSPARKGDRGGTIFRARVTVAGMPTGVFALEPVAEAA